MRSCVVLVDKPVGPTSFDIVRSARRGVSGRVGHAGTLDPFASGLLLVMIGHATRVSNLLMAGRCMSADQLALSSARVSTTCSMMGQAAGIAAALAARGGSDPRRLDAREVRREVEKRGARLS